MFGWLRRAFIRSKYDFFVSYKSGDSNVARQVAEYLIATGRSVWFAEFNVLIDNYDRFQEAIDHAATNSLCAILFTSDDWLESEYCRREAELLCSNLAPDSIFEILLPYYVDEGFIPGVPNWDRRVSEKPTAFISGLLSRTCDGKRHHRCTHFSPDTAQNGPWTVIDYLSRCSQVPTRFPVTSATPVGLTESDSLFANPRIAVMLHLPYGASSHDVRTVPIPSQIEARRTICSIPQKWRRELFEENDVEVSIELHMRVHEDPRCVFELSGKRQYLRLMKESNEWAKKYDVQIRGLHLVHWSPFSKWFAPHDGSRLSQFALTCEHFSRNLKRHVWLRQYFLFMETPDDVSIDVVCMELFFVVLPLGLPERLPSRGFFSLSPQLDSIIESVTFNSEIRRDVEVMLNYRSDLDISNKFERI